MAATEVSPAAPAAVARRTDSSFPAMEMEERPEMARSVTPASVNSQKP